MVVSRKLMWLCLLAVTLIGFVVSSGRLLAQEDKVDLSLRLLADSYYREVIPGESTILFMEIRNNGTTVITDIKLRADKPEDWAVDFQPNSISYLSAGSSQTIDVNILPSQSANKGEYSITLLAEANETRSATSTILRVEGGPSFWLWIGIGVAALVIAGFVIVFLRFGRQ